MKSFSLTQLGYIVALDETKHFGLAAKKANISQPTLSLQIQKLEEELGVSLFDRSKQPIVPTEVGVKVLDQARRILSEARALESIVDETQEVAGTFSLGIIPTLAPYLVSRFVPGLLKKFPKLDLRLIEVMTDQMVQKLHRDELDAGILVTPLNDTGIQEFPLFYEPLWVYLPKDHPLSKKKTLSMSDLDEKDILLLQEGHCFRTQMLEVCRHRRQKKSHGFDFQSGSFEALVSLVDEGVGFTILPELAVDAMKKRGHDTKQLRPFTQPQPVREVSLIRSRLFVKKKIADSIADLIKNELKSLSSRKVPKSSILPI